MNTTTPSLGVMVGLPVAGLTVLIGLVCVAFGIRMYATRNGSNSYYYDDDLAAPFTFGGLAVVVGALVITGFTMWPWSAEYHQWTPVSGKVSDVQSRLLSAGDNNGTTQRFVVRFDGEGQEYACDDTRCSLLKVGDQLDLSCKRAWQYTGTDGWDCNYVGSRRNS